MTKQSKIIVSIIINYFNPNESLLLSTMLDFVLESISSHTQYKFELIVSDGSGKKSLKLFEKCSGRGWKYLFTEEKVGFAYAYNRGMEAATGDYRVWMASDIIVSKGWESKLISEMIRTSSWMAAPYLTNSDYAGQVYNWVAKMHTFYPSAMTFNLNMITRECYEKVGLMDEQFSGCFNDVDYLIRIREFGGKAIVVDAGHVLHVARATVSESTMVNGSQDMQRFIKKYPYLQSSRLSMQYDSLSSIFYHSNIYRQLLRTCYLIPINSISNRAVRFVMKFEPFFHKC